MRRAIRPCAPLRILEEKGHARHEADGPRYVYLRRGTTATRPAQSAMRHLVQTFFDGSTGDAVAALLGTDASRLSSDELERLAELIAGARKEDA